jgi:sarcosine oxidase gamma subunit
MAAIIASGTSELASSDIVVVAGTPTTIFVNDANGKLVPEDVRVAIQIKAASGQYMTVAELSRALPAIVIDGPGTYRALRKVCTTAVAVDQD